jgi:hypothetical protein
MANLAAPPVLQTRTTAHPSAASRQSTILLLSKLATSATLAVIRPIQESQSAPTAQQQPFQQLRPFVAPAPLVTFLKTMFATCALTRRKEAYSIVPLAQIRLAL